MATSWKMCEYTIESWNEVIHGFQRPHVLQTQEWGQVKSRFGWKPVQMVWEERAKDTGNAFPAAALILARELKVKGLVTGVKVLYVPKGPLLDWESPNLRRQVLADLAGYAHKERAIFIKIDPDVCLGTGIPGHSEAVDTAIGKNVVDELTAEGWRFSEEQIQFRNTVLLDLSVDESELLSKMKSKTRYNIRLSERKGVKTRVANLQDLDFLYRMYAQTADRDGFVIREKEYYLYLWRTFIDAGWAEGIIAEVNETPIAGMILFHFGDRAWYMNGMSLKEHREMMPNHLLQWHAMRLLKSRGVRWYDLWGAPDVFSETDPLWGVFRFKEGFGGEVVRHLGAWDLPVRPRLYQLYTHLLPRILKTLRRQGMRNTRRLVTEAG